jgi:hypothetical protein
MNVLFSELKIDVFHEYLVNDDKAVNVSGERASHEVKNA